MDTTELRKLMSECFDSNELEILAFDLKIEMGELVGPDASDQRKVIRLIKYMQRNKRYDELVSCVNNKCKDSSRVEPESNTSENESFSSSSSYYTLNIGTILIDHQKRQYKVVEQLKASLPEMEAGLSYRAIDTRSYPFFIKTFSFKKRKTPANIKEIRDRVKEFDKHFNNEFLQMQRLEGVTGIARIISRGETDLSVENSKKPIKVPFLVQEYIRGISLDKYLDNLGKDITAHTQSPTISLGANASAADWVSFAKQLLTIVGSVHKVGVAHGDIKPSNIIVQEGRPVLVDFGQAYLWIKGQVYGSPIAKSREPGYIAPERVMQVGRSRNDSKPSTSGDIYALGGILYTLATGRVPPKPYIESNGNTIGYIPDPNIFGSDLDPNDAKLSPEDIYKVKSLWKEKIFNGLKEHCNSSILKDYPGLLDIIALCMHYYEEHRARHTEDVLDTLDAFSCATGFEDPPQLRDVIKGASRLIEEFVDLAYEPGLIKDSLFSQMLETDLLRLQRRIKDIRGGYQIEINGSRDEIITGLLKFMSELRSGDRYLTITTPEFWLPNNLGYSGRFMRVNELLALRGVSIKRIFLIADTDLQLGSPHYPVLQAHAELSRAILAQGHHSIDSGIETKGYFGGFVEFKAKDKNKLGTSMRNLGDLVAIIQRSNGEIFGLFFRTEPIDRVIHRIEVRKMLDKTESSKFQKELAKHVQNAAPLKDFFLV